MAIDLSTPEGRSSYLNDKLSDLINGVDCTYGNIIFDELLKRIDKTIMDFNFEMEEIFSELKSNEKKRQTIITKLKKQADNEESDEREREKKEWEQKLLDLYGKDQQSGDSDETLDTNNQEEKK